MKSLQGIQKTIYYLSRRKLVPSFSLSLLARALKPLEDNYFDKLHNKLRFRAVYLHCRVWKQRTAACFRELFRDMMASPGFLRIHQHHSECLFPSMHTYTHHRTPLIGLMIPTYPPPNRHFPSHQRMTKKVLHLRRSDSKRKEFSSYPWWASCFDLLDNHRIW